MTNDKPKSKGPDSPTTGSPTPTAARSPAPSDSTRKLWPTSSETTGTPSPASAAANPIGAPLSETGAGTKLNDEPYRMAVLPEHLETARVEALRGRYFGMRVKAETTWADGDLRFFGYRLIGQADAVAVPARVWQACLDELNPHLDPAGAMTIAAELSRLGALTVPRREGETDGELRALAYAQELSAYPADVVIWACREWPRTADGKWFPAWAELRALCERRIQRRRALADLCAAQLARLAQGPLQVVEQPRQL